MATKKKTTTKRKTTTRRKTTTKRKTTAKRKTNGRKACLFAAGTKVKVKAPYMMGGRRGRDEWTGRVGRVVEVAPGIGGCDYLVTFGGRTPDVWFADTRLELARR